MYERITDDVCLPPYDCESRDWKLHVRHSHAVIDQCTTADHIYVFGDNHLRSLRAQTLANNPITAAAQSH